MTSALGPLFHAEKFVLVGDPNQLPPVVTSGAAKARGLDNSLFSHLAVKGQNVIPLTMQYRMNSAIQASFYLGTQAFTMRRIHVDSI